MLATAQRNTENSGATADAVENILVLGAPFNALRYSLAVTGVLAVVSAVLLSLNYY